VCHGRRGLRRRSTGLLIRRGQRAPRDLLGRELAHRARVLGGEHDGRHRNGRDRTGGGAASGAFDRLRHGRRQCSTRSSRQRTGGPGKAARGAASGARAAGVVRRASRRAGGTNGARKILAFSRQKF